MASQRDWHSAGEAARLFQLVIDNIPQHIFWKDTDSVYLGCNANFAKVAGVWPPEAIIGKTDFDLAWKKDEAEFFRQVDRRVMDSGVPEYHIIEPQLQAGGRQAWLDTNKMPLFDAEGRVVGILGTYEDVTERMLAEHALREQEANLRTTLHAIADGVISTDALGRIMRMNPAAEALTRVPLSVAKGRALGEVYLTFSGGQARFPRNVFELVRRAATAPLQSSDVQLSPHQADPVEISETASPMIDTKGTFEGVVIVFRDVTRQRRTEEHLRHAQKMEAIGELAGGIAHDFNNMLAGIRTSAELMQRRLEGKGELSRFADGIVKTSRRAADLTAKLLSFSRRGRTKDEPLDLHEAIRDAASIVERSIDRRVVLNLSLGASESFVMGDTAQLEAAFLNLAINSRDAMPEGGELALSTENVILDPGYCAATSFDVKPGLYIKARVRDTGHGIPPELMSRVFEPFFTTKPMGRGTGLGLSAVYGAVTEHSGALEVTSQPGATVFDILLPVVSGAHRPAVAAEYEAPPGCGTVLLVDDEGAIREAAGELLEQLGYRVLTAKDGREGVEVFERHAREIAVVLLDVIMPKLGGLDCFRALRRIDPRVRVVIASGFAEDHVIRKLLDEGALGFVNKPYGASQLAQVLHRAITQEI